MLIRSIILFLFSISSIAFGQQDSCNKFNAQGKKNGYWKYFFDENVFPTDSINASFWAYLYMDNGKFAFDYSRNGYGVKKHKNQYTYFDGEKMIKGSPRAIFGTLRISYHKKDSSVLLCEYTFVNGCYPKVFREYDNGQLQVLMDFTKKYNNMNGTFYFTDYFTNLIKNKRKTTCYWFRKENDKWQSVGTSCE